MVDTKRPKLITANRLVPKTKRLIGKFLLPPIVKVNQKPRNIMTKTPENTPFILRKSRNYMLTIALKEISTIHQRHLNILDVSWKEMERIEILKSNLVLTFHGQSVMLLVRKEVCHSLGFLMEMNAGEAIALICILNSTIPSAIRYAKKLRTNIRSVGIT